MSFVSVPLQPHLQIIHAGYDSSEKHQTAGTKNAVQVTLAEPIATFSWSVQIYQAMIMTTV